MNPTTTSGAPTPSKTPLTDSFAGNWYRQLAEDDAKISDIFDFARALEAHNAELRAALEGIETICTESTGDCRKRMGTRVGNALVAARAALAKGREGSGT